MDRNELLENMKKIYGCRQMNAEHCFDGCSVCDFYCTKEKRDETFKTVIAMLEGKDTNVPTWIPVSERLPACEQEVLICTKVKLVGKDAYIDSIITPAFYEDGTMTENDSAWRWEEVDWAGWDEEEDCGIIPEGWWENRHFNPDDLLNCPVDREVVAWMPLPQPYKEE